MPRKNSLNSVVARFEETIEQNNAAGVCSGMYLTNQVTRSPLARRKSNASRRHSCQGPDRAKENRVTNRRRSNGNGGSLHHIQAGTYRNMFKNTDATVNTASTAETTEEDEWDPFNDDANEDEDDDNMSFSEESSFGNDDGDGSAVVSLTVRKERPKAKKSAGRRSNRISKPKKSRKDASKKEGTCNKKASTPNLTEDEDDGDQSDDGGGFALTYISARDKFTALTKQNSDRQLCKQPSLRKPLSGLKMTSKENVLSTSSNHSTSSHRRGSLSGSSHRRGSLSRDGSSRSVENESRSSTVRRSSEKNLLDFENCSSPQQVAQDASSHRRGSLSRDGSSRSVGNGSISSTVRRASEKNLLDFDNCSSPRQVVQDSVRSKVRTSQQEKLSPTERESSYRSSSKLDPSSHRKSSRSRAKSLLSDKRKNNGEVRKPSCRSSLRVARTSHHSKADR